jgi:hypothetical protein
MFVIGSNDSSFFEVLKSSVIASFLHEEQLFAIPAIEGD